MNKVIRFLLGVTALWLVIGYAAGSGQPAVAQGPTVYLPLILHQPDVQPTFPIRAAFYYPWFPEAWQLRNGVAETRFQPTLGYYDVSDPAVIQQHIAAMQYGQIEAGIISWWSLTHESDQRVAPLLAATRGSTFRWTLYYEREARGDPTIEELRADLQYIADHYGDDPSYLRIQGRFVIFVYSDNAIEVDDCELAARWRQANTVNAYIILNIFSGARACAIQPDLWHQYGPATASSHQAGYSFSISPGFWKHDEANARLVRDVERWRADIQAMLASNTPLHLITTFNEWGEGTAVESAAEWASPSGYGRFLDALHDAPAKTPALTAPPTVPLNVTTTATPTLTPTTTPTATLTVIPTIISTVIPTITSTVTPAVTSTPSLIPTAPWLPPLLTPTRTTTPTPAITVPVTPTVVPTPLPTATTTPLPTMTATLLPTATETKTPVATATPLPTMTATLLPTAIETKPPVATATHSPTAIATSTDTPTATATATPTATATASATLTATATLTTTPSPAAGISINAVGDIAACTSAGDEATAALLDTLPGPILTLGDTVYESGTTSEFANCFEPTWGRHKARIRPAVGNHEYLSPNAAPYFAYFGAAAGDPAKGYYSYQVGDWQIFVLNSNCSRAGGCQLGSPQNQWLRQELAAHPTRCTLAYLHHPLWSSGKYQLQNQVRPLVQALYDHHADLLLAGHAHNYERFAPQDPAGNLDPDRGIVEIIVGSGGKNHQPADVAIRPNSQVRNSDTFGVLHLTLYADRYHWRFVPVAGGIFTDEGWADCQ